MARLNWFSRVDGLNNDEIHVRRGWAARAYMNHEGGYSFTVWDPEDELVNFGPATSMDDAKARAEASIHVAMAKREAEYPEVE